MSSLYKKEFPDYDDVLKIPLGFIDNSWHNDTCPSILRRYIDTEHTCVDARIFQDYKNPLLRESEINKRYSFAIEANSEVIMWKQSDDWDVIEELINMLG